MGKEYLITWDKNKYQLSLEQDINNVIYIKKFKFLNVSKAKNELLRNTVFQRLMSDNDFNIDDEFFYKYQMEQIRLGLENNLDVSIYTTLNKQGEPVFDNLQMREIRVGLYKRLKVTVYAKPEFDWYKMHQMRYSLENN